MTGDRETRPVSGITDPVTDSSGKETSNLILPSTAPIVAGISIPKDDQGRYDLNALHRASGTGTHKAPNRWLATDIANGLFDALMADLTQTPIQEFGYLKPISVVRGGAKRGTFAHESLAVGYATWISPKFHLTVINAFIDSKSVNSAVVPQSLPDALRLAADLAEQNAQLKQSQDALNRISGSDGDLTLSNAAKALKLKPKNLNRWLNTNGWIFKRAGKKNWIAYQSKLDQQLLTHRVYPVALNDSSTRLVEQVLVTPKGLAKLASLEVEL